MPIEKPETDRFTIRELQVIKKHQAEDNGYAMSLVCPSATAFVLCFSKGDEPIKCESLGLTDDDLRKLHKGGIEMQKGDCRLLGVTASTFYALHQFSDFTVDPPERIQVWSMVCNDHGDVTLFIPKNETVCYVPLRCKAYCSNERRYSVLTLEVEKTANYTDGALMYRVGESDPVPIPKSWLGTQIRLKSISIEDIGIVVHEDFTEKYTVEKIVQ